jgi:hypothetical protein
MPAVLAVNDHRLSGKKRIVKKPRGKIEMARGLPTVSAMIREAERAARARSRAQAQFLKLQNKLI